ncbi:hypothetical protein [Spirillospora sp. CA-128828]|uniref:hypothetical protein n=1 Tax=Spirillospora sp. CA-128828 TaxID=3240033 RepID=UPI003D8C8B89
MAADLSPGGRALAELREQFPGWQIDCHHRGALPWEARRLRIRPPGGVACIVAAEPGHLRELLTAATAINTRNLGRLP